MKDIKLKIPLIFKKHLRIGIGITIFFSILALLFCKFIMNLFPVHFGEKETQVFKVEYGTSIREVANLLKSKKLIRSKLIFEIYVRSNKSNNVEAGCYKIGAGMSIPRIVNELHRGIPPGIHVTIPEGLNNKELLVY